MSSSSASPPIYRALLSRSLHQLRSGMMPPAVSLQVCTALLLSSSSVSSSSSSESALASGFTSRFAATHVPLLTPGQAMRIISCRNNSNIQDGEEEGDCDWWLTLSGAALHEPLLAATLRRLQTCRTALATPCLAKAVRSSISASVFNSSVQSSCPSPSSTSSVVKKKPTALYYNMLVEELTSRLEVLSNNSVGSRAKNASAILEDAETSIELAKLLSLVESSSSSSSSALPTKLVTAILSFLDEALPRLSSETREGLAHESGPWWRATLAAAADTGIFVPQLDVAIARELQHWGEDEEEAGGRRGLLSADAKKQSRRALLRSQLAEAQTALTEGESRCDSLERRRRFISALLVLPVRGAPSDNFFLLRCVVFLAAWSKVLPLTGEERELLRPVIHSPSFASRVASVSNTQGAAVALGSLM